MRKIINTPILGIIICIVSVIVEKPTAIAAPVLLERDGSIARGIARARAHECFVIAPLHFISKSEIAGATPKPIGIVGPNGSQAIGYYNGWIGSQEDDLALVAVQRGEESVCDESEMAEIRSKVEAVLALREKRGDLTYVPVDIVSPGHETIEITSRSNYFRLAEAMSGATLIESGRSKGILLSAKTDEEIGYIASLDAIAARLGAWTRDPSTDLKMIRDSLEIIESARRTRPLGDIGQIAAIEGLVRAGSKLSGADLAGFDISNANLRDGIFIQSRMLGTTFSESNLSHADLSRSGLRFSSFVSTMADKSVLDQAVLEFSDLTNASFKNSSAEGTSFMGARAQQSMFDKANLKNASFAFADLTGASFKGADLSGVVFAGANLTGATFDGAKLEETDFTGATGSIEQFDDNQVKEMCARQKGSSKYLSVGLMEVVPSTQYKSGKDYNDLTNGQYFNFEPGLSKFRRCDRNNYHSGKRNLIWEHKGVERFVEDRKFSAKSDVTSAGGRGEVFSNRILEYSKQLNKTHEQGQFLEFKAKVHSTASAALNDAIAAYPNNEIKPFYLDSQLSDAIDAVAWNEKMDEKGWHRLALRRLELEQERRLGSSQSVKQRNYWPPVFPESFTTDSLRSVDVDAFADWIRSLVESSAGELVYNTSVLYHSNNFTENREFSLTKKLQKRGLKRATDVVSNLPVSVDPNEIVVISGNVLFALDFGSNDNLAPKNLEITSQNEIFKLQLLLAFSPNIEAKFVVEKNRYAVVRAKILEVRFLDREKQVKGTVKIQ